MYYEFYIDIFFVENLILNDLVLLLTGILSKSKIHIRRILLGSFIGAAGACGLVICSLENFLWINVFSSAILPVGMVMLGFGIQSKKRFAQRMLAFYASALLMGSCCQILKERISLPLIPQGLIAVSVLTFFLKVKEKLRERTQELYEVDVSLHGKTVKLLGIRDTGNQLLEPITGRPVNIVSYHAVKELLDKDEKIFLIPYHSIGKNHGLLPGITFDEIQIKGEDTSQRIERPVIALSKIPVNQEGRYQMILHPLILDH